MAELLCLLNCNFRAEAPENGAGQRTMLAEPCCDGIPPEITAIGIKTDHQCTAVHTDACKSAHVLQKAPVERVAACDAAGALAGELCTNVR